MVQTKKKYGYERYEIQADAGEAGDPKHWRFCGQKRVAPLESVIGSQAVITQVAEDFEKFCSSSTKSWFSRHDIPYRRRYLFHGSPHSDVNRLACALASKMDGPSEMGFVNTELVTPNYIGNDEFLAAMRDCQQPGIIVIEDIDVLVNETELTYDGIAKALESVGPSEPYLIIVNASDDTMPSNKHIRSLQFDRKFCFDPLGEKEISEAFRRFYPQADPSLANKFALQILERQEEGSKSAAGLRQLFLYTREIAAEKVIESLPKFYKEHYVNDGSSM